MPVRALRHCHIIGELCGEALRQNPINARKGIKTLVVDPPLYREVRQNPINARKGIKTRYSLRFPEGRLCGQNPINARKGIKTYHLARRVLVYMRPASESYQCP